MGKSIIVIEDEEELRSNICKMLNLLGINTIEASDGEEGLKKIEENSIDLIISDIKMPKMDGYDLLSKIKNNNEKNTIPFIFLTSNIEKDQIRKGMNIGADDYLTKPFSIEDLASSIRTRFEKAGKLDEFYTNKFNAIIDSVEDNLLKNSTSGLPNINKLNKDIEKEKNNYDDSNVHFLFNIEIDGSHEIMSFFSPHSIDNLQRGIIDKLKINLKEYSSLYHLDDLEFAVYSKEKKMFMEPKNIGMYAEEILRTVREPFASENFNLSISASIGISVIESGGIQYFDTMLKDAKSAKLYIQKDGGNKYFTYDHQLQHMINKRISTDLKKHIDMHSISQSTDKKNNMYETKIFFLYPQSIIQNQLINEIIRNEYAAYILNDHKTALHLLEKYDNSIIFINIDAVLPDDEWKKYIADIQNDPRFANVRVGIISHIGDEKKEEYYLMQLLISCGFIKMKSSFNESLQLILKVLEANEAKGKRKFVRVSCSEKENVSCNMKINNTIYKGKIIDISSAGMAFSFLKDNETFLKENSVIDKIQLLLQEKICHLSGSVKGERQINGKIIYVILFDKVNHEDSNKIHDFIFNALQDEIKKEIAKL
jgi:DNA-binding response OmpR family regulator